MFIIGHLYTKKDIYEILKVPIAEQKGIWDTGYRLYNDEIFIFVNINTVGRSGHDHSNHWIGDILYWEAKGNSSIEQPIIQKMLDSNINKHIYTRTDNKSPFVYEGLGNVNSYEISKPVKISWRFDQINNIDTLCEHEVPQNDILKEGSIQQITINAYERNTTARRKCIEYYGYNCGICGFNYKEKYGEYADNFIQVHHIKPIAEIKSEYVLDPISDLIPICANCHSVIHRRKTALTPKELKRMLE